MHLQIEADRENRSRNIFVLASKRILENCSFAHVRQSTVGLSAT